MRACSEYQFDDEMESAISMFATQTKKDAKVRRALNSLTYEDVYWASKIENPLVKISYSLRNAKADPVSLIIEAVFNKSTGVGSNL
jgi:hypothetical protein